MNNLEKDFRLYAKDRGVSSGLLDGYTNYINQYIEPTIVEERKMNATQISVFSRLFMDRILFLGTEINSDVANIINSQLLFLQSENPSKQITMYINSPGGSVYDGMSIYDVMQFINCPVATTCCGTAASMAAVLLSSGEKGMRSALPHSQIMVHAPSGGTGRATAPDFRIAAAEMEKCENMLYTVLAENMDKDFDYVKKICDRDYWLTPEESVSEHIIDKIIKKK
jgi:ATP-dependent Clp protease protease subunit